MMKASTKYKYGVIDPNAAAKKEALDKKIASIGTKAQRMPLQKTQSGTTFPNRPPSYTTQAKRTTVKAKGLRGLSGGRQPKSKVTSRKRTVKQSWGLKNPVSGDYSYHRSK